MNDKVKIEVDVSMIATNTYEVDRDEYNELVKDETLSDDELFEILNDMTDGKIEKDFDTYHELNFIDIWGGK